MSAFFNMNQITDIRKLIDDLKGFNAGDVLQEIVENNLELLADLQRDQWMEGRGGDGEFIRPYYSENPYFKTPESAKKYAKWKQIITPNPQRPEDVPNLFINGYLHSSLYTSLRQDVFDITSDVDFAPKVFDVHKNAQGLNEEKRLLFAENITLPEFSKVLKEKTGLEL